MADCCWSAANTAYSRLSAVCQGKHAAASQNQRRLCHFSTAGKLKAVNTPSSWANLTFNHWHPPGYTCPEGGLQCTRCSGDPGWLWCAGKPTQAQGGTAGWSGADGLRSSGTARTAGGRRAPTAGMKGTGVDVEANEPNTNHSLK